MPSVPRRLHSARLHPATLANAASSPPSPSFQQPHTLPTHSITLTTAELHYIVNRRLRNDNLPDDPHTLLAERMTSLITIFSSFCAKLYLLERTPLVNLPTKRPRLATVLRILAISQLRPLRILALPLIRFFRPLSWLLAPFAAMSLPVAVHILAKYIIRQLTPAPPPRPEFVDRLVERAAEVCETVTETVDRARQAIETDLQHYFNAHPPQLPTLSDIVPTPFSNLVPSEMPQTEHLDASSVTAPAPSEEETVIRSPLPALGRRTGPPGLSALIGPGAGIAVSSTTRLQTPLNSDMGSEVDSDTTSQRGTAEKSWWHKASS